MKLNEWRKENGYSIEKLARKLDLSSVTARKICIDGDFKTTKIIRKVYEFTGGEVTLNDMIELN